MSDDDEKDMAAAEFRVGRVDSNVEFDAAAKLSNDDEDAGELVAMHDAAAAEWRRLRASRALWGGSEDRARKASSGRRQRQATKRSRCLVLRVLASNTPEGPIDIVPDSVWFAGLSTITKDRSLIRMSLNST